jgi:hypothetical protein
MFEIFEMFEKVLAGLYAPPWDVAIKEWEGNPALPAGPAGERAAALETHPTPRS